uniref:Craniofacial development protein 1 n=1 Tax=Meleagris gallopavo TaxID=9103 RepID=A0A803YMW2_MELGA
MLCCFAGVEELQESASLSACLQLVVPRSEDCHTAHRAAASVRSSGLLSLEMCSVICRVTKEVDSNSKEAKSFLKQQEKWQSSAPGSLPTVSGVKRPSGISSLLGKIGSKKQKMSTLEKSKLDWENFKEEEGIVEELAIHNRGKDGHRSLVGTTGSGTPSLPFLSRCGVEVSARVPLTLPGPDGASSKASASSLWHRAVTPSWVHREEGVPGARGPQAV